MDEKPKILDVEYWPRRLLEIPDPPKKLWIRGKLPPKDFKTLCIVGSRKYSNYGKEACEYLIEGLRGLPVVIVSGLAYGIDIVAHKKALEVGLLCMAIPGSGLLDNSIYPKAHMKIAKEIIENGGCLISEFPPGFLATNYAFPQRNRIMVGFSENVLIMEAAMKSGTMITSRMAADYNRNVLTVPHTIFNTGSKGPHYLIKNGATPITCQEDLREALGFDDEKIRAEIFESLDDNEKKIFEILDAPKTREELLSELRISADDLSRQLTLLELKGLIKEEFGSVQLSLF